MAADLKAMHRPRRVDAPVYGPPDADGKRHVIGTVTTHYGIPRRDRHRLAMGQGSR